MAYTHGTHQDKRRAKLPFALLFFLILLLTASLCIAEADESRVRSSEYQEAMDRLWLFSSMTDGLYQAEAITAIDPNKPMVALTFDDGPSQYTERILDILTQNDARATFFMVGNRVANYTGTVERVALQGSEIATHTWSHVNLKNVSSKEVASQLTRSISSLESASGQTVLLMRPPYGSINDTVRSVCKRQGLPIIRWSIDTLDWQTRNAQDTYDAIMKSVQHGSIILCHDIVPSTVDAMERVIPELKRRGYQLVTITEMFTAAGVHLEPGRAYDRLKTE